MLEQRLRKLLPALRTPKSPSVIVPSVIVAMNRATRPVSGSCDFRSLSATTQSSYEWFAVLFLKEKLRGSGWIDFSLLVVGAAEPVKPTRKPEVLLV